ncbi:B3 domain-containing protein [Arabidopsis thaliana]
MSSIMYHDNHLTDSGKNMSSGLSLLAYVTVMVAEEEEQRSRLLAEKREESKCKMSFFYLFPRKIRSSLAKRRYTQQNPNGASTCSSKPTNPSFDEPMVCDEEQRLKKGKSKIVCDEDYDEASEKKLFDNLNGASTSSSSLLNLPCLEPSTETKDVPNPNYQSSSSSSCLTENKKRNRRAVEQRKSGKVKKVKVSPLPRLCTEMPEWIFQVMRYMNADAETPKLIFERTLFKSDVNSNLSRLLMPFQKLIRNDFLTPAECRAMQKDEDNDEEDDENIGVGTVLVNQRFQKWGLRFKIWAMEKDTGHGTLNYTLNWGWNDVVKSSSLKVGDKISLWTFRCRGVLCFALDTE